MSTNISSETPKKNESWKNILIIVLLILIVISGIKLYTDSIDRTKKAEEIIVLTEETNDLNKRLDSMTYQLDLRIQEIAKLGGEVDSLVSIREQLVRERNTDSRRTEAQIVALNKKIDTYSNLLKEKDDDIIKLREINDELLSENQELKTDKAEIEEEMVKLNLKQQELEEKVNIAAKLKAENIIVAAVNNRGRERVGEFRNRQLEKLKVSFNLADNPVSEPGTKDIFVQVVSPNNQIIFDIARGSGTFRVDGREEFYTAKQDILFDNSRQELTYYYEKGSDYNTGRYEVRIFADGFLIGNQAFEIK
ncbi:coiled-coil domain-containing protein [Pararhodonellum marinum]|uniref:coiled-coil domain-containing protein n=1 Tax=Pararhodonellum marinum TaxID=2755358 RepID=UPI00188DDB14|nr:hypothetical protein [Pararhodonellum marinum]